MKEERIQEILHTIEGYLKDIKAGDILEISINAAWGDFNILKRGNKEILRETNRTLKM